MTKAKFLFYLGASGKVFIFILIYELILSTIVQPTSPAASECCFNPLSIRFVVFEQMLFSVIFTLVFLKGYKSSKYKGSKEGIRYGACFGLLFIPRIFISSPVGLFFSSAQPPSAALVLLWSLALLIECAIAGLILAAEYQMNRNVFES